jgi:hypothetical protein
MQSGREVIADHRANPFVELTVKNPEAPGSQTRSRRGLGKIAFQMWDGFSPMSGSSPKKKPRHSAEAKFAPFGRMGDNHRPFEVRRTCIGSRIDFARCAWTAIVGHKQTSCSPLPTARPCGKVRNGDNHRFSYSASRCGHRPVVWSVHVPSPFPSPNGIGRK